MSIFITKESKETIDNIMIQLENDINLERKIELKKNPKITYRFNAKILIDQNIYIKFIDGMPNDITYNNTLIGRASFNQLNESDFMYEIGLIDNFKEFLKCNKDFILIVGYSYGDGCYDGGFFSQIYNPNGRSYINFTIFDQY